MQYNKVELGDLLLILTDYHANGAYQKLKENVELFDEEDFALMVRTTNFESDNFTESLKFISEHAYNFLDKSKVYAGDLVMNKIANAGSIYMMPDLKRPVSLAMNLFLLRIDESKANPVYIYIYLKVHEAYVKQFANGSVTKTITKDAVRNLEISLPPRAIQDQIATQYNSLRQKLDVNTRINQILEQMAQAIFKSWFVDFDPVKAKMRGEQPEGMDEATASLFPEKLVESELGLIPEGWEVNSLSELIKLTGGGTPKRSEETYWNGDIPWFSVKDVPSGSNVFVVNTDEKITELGLNKSSTKLLPKGTTIITARGTVGKLALVGTDMCMNQSCYGIRGKDVGDYYNYFNLKQAVSTLQQNTHGAVFDTITTKTFDTYSMAFSGAELANKFDALVAPLLQKVEANVRQNIELATLRDTLLPKLLSGEIELDSVVAK